MEKADIICAKFSQRLNIQEKHMQLILVKITQEKMIYRYSSFLLPKNKSIQKKLQKEVFRT